MKGPFACTRCDIVSTNSVFVPTKTELVTFKCFFRQAETELAATILLVIELIETEQLATPFLKTATPPVLFPKCHLGEVSHGTLAGCINLYDVFPARGSQSRSKPTETMGLGIGSRTTQTIFKTHGTATAALGLRFQPFH